MRKPSEKALCTQNAKRNDFSEYQRELKYLFDVYTDKEIETLVILLTKLYAGIENLEKRTAESVMENSKKEI